MQAYRIPAMSRAVAFQHPSSLDHDTGPHPERPARITAIVEALDARDWVGFERHDSPAAELDAIHAVHPPAHTAAIERAASSGRPLDADTAVSPGSWPAALHAAGGAVAVVDELLSAGAAIGASLHRPPGHHAETARAMGFCLLNSVAIAARHARHGHGVERVMVLDWDVHHGNGTSEIFYEDPSVLFCSIHESPLYPGSGAASELGSGAGEGLNVNLPVPAGSGDAVFRSLVEHVAAPLARAYEPQLILVSAGFDAHADDPLASCVVTEHGFAAMAATVRDVARDLDVPVGIVLEGGYALDALGRSVVATLEAAAGDEPSEQAEEHPLALRARERLARYWPSL
jgi:acetoin utilization deacetylase AcuC-like enzyme